MTVHRSSDEDASAGHGQLFRASLRQGSMQPLTAVGDSVLKRSFDITGSVLGLLFLSPLFLLIALLIKLTDGGPVFYGHRRVGRHRREFICWKFRTMTTEADRLLEAYLAENPAAMMEWRATHKLKHDPRVTAIGAVLRKFSLDEVPQLFNVLNGRMSIVGPRPVVADELHHYGANVAYYLQARPGLTGLWQVSGRNDVSYDLRVDLDRRYVETWTLGNDIVILMRTIPAVCFRRGSY